MGWSLRLIAGVLVIGAATLAAVSQWSHKGPPAERPPASSKAVASAASAAQPTRGLHPETAAGDHQPVVAPKPRRDPDDERREKLVGVWKQHYTGVRWLRIRPDGTATMYVDPDWSARLVIGDHLTMQIEWTVAEGRALFKSVSGEPESAFKAVNTLFGRDRNRPITELTDDTFVLLDEEDGSKSEWTRVGPGEKLPKPLAE